MLNRTRQRLTALITVLLLGSCADQPTGPNHPDTPAPQPSTALGPVEVTIRGVGTGDVTASAQPYGEGGGLTADYSLSGIGDGSGSASGTIQLEHVSSGSFTHGTRGSGGYSYLWATFNVRNAQLDGTPYSTPRENLTFMAVDTDGTIGQSAFSRLNRFDGSAADRSIAAEVLPTGAVYQESGQMKSVEPDVLQLFDESELAGRSVPQAVHTVFPYGFIVRHATRTDTRTLPANPAPDQFDGVVTFAVKIPLQASEPEDPYTVSIVVLPMDDSETRITQSPQEQSPAARAAFEQRAALLGASEAVIVPGGGYDGTAQLRPLCSVRVAGTESAVEGTLEPCSQVSDLTASFTSGGSTQAGEAVTFDASASTGENLTYAWDFGDGVRGGTETVPHIYPRDGSYDVTLTVANLFGYSDTATRTLSISAAPAATGTADLEGLVLSPAGDSIADVTVTQVGGSLSGTTGANGIVSISEVPTGVPTTFALSKNGYASKFVRMEIADGLTEAKFRATLRARNTAQTLTSAESGGAVSGEDGASITLPEGALTDSNGNPVTGDVQVALTPVDVSGAEIGAFPGSFGALDSSGDDGVLLSYGVAEFHLTQNGEELQIAPGKTATIEIPIYTGGAQAGDAIALWSLDEATGVWVQEGTGTVVSSTASPTGLALRANITHLSWWNADHWTDPYRPIPRCKVRDQNGLPTLDLSGDCYIRGSVVGPNGPRSQPTTTVPPTGGVPLPVPPGMDVRLEAYGENGTVYGDTVINGGAGGGGEVVIVVESVNQAVGGTIAPDTSFTATIDPAGEVDTYTLSGTAGQVIALDVRQSGSTLRGTVALRAGDGTMIEEQTFDSDNADIIAELTATGNYRIEVDGTLNEPGAYQLSLSEVVVQPIAIDTTFTDSIEPVGNRKRYTFSGTAGQWVQIDGVPSTNLYGTISLAIEGETPFAEGTLTSSSSFSYPMLAELPVTGTYVVEVDASNNEPGSYALSLEEAAVVALNTNTSGTIGSEDEQVFVFHATAGTYVTTGAVGGDGASSSIAHLDNARLTETDYGSRIYEIPADGYYRLKVETTRYENGGSYTVGLATLEAPTPLTFDSQGRAALENQPMEIVGDHHYYTLPAAAGDGLVVTASGSVGVSGLPSRWARLGVSRIGSGTYVAPVEASTMAVDFHDGAGIIEQAGGTLPGSGTDTYLIEVEDRRNSATAATYDLLVDHAATSTALTVDDDLAECAQAETRSLHAALYAVAGGGTVTTCAGRYEESLALPIHVDGVTLTGTAQSDVVLSELDGGTAVLSVEAANTVIENLTFEGRGNVGYYSTSAISFMYGSGSAIIRDVTVRPVTGLAEIAHAVTGVPQGSRIERLTTEDTENAVYLDGSNVTVTQSTFIRTTSTAISDGGYATYGAATITDNTIDMVGGTGRAIQVAGDGHWIENNTITVDVDAYRNDAAIYLNANTGAITGAPAVVRNNQITSNASGFYLHMGAGTSVTIEQNRFTTSEESPGSGIEAFPQDGAGTVTVRNNVFDGVGANRSIDINRVEAFDNVVIANNTLRHGSAVSSSAEYPTVRFVLADGTFTGALTVTMVNNIFSGVGGTTGVEIPAGTTIDSDHNLFHNYSTVYGGGSTSTGTSDIVGQAPLFTNILLDVGASSPAVDAGAASTAYADVPSTDYDGTARPQGAGVDIGAHEQ